jgi:hypothetical protein
MSTRQTTITRAADGQGSGLFVATVTCKDGRVVEDVDTEDALSTWLWHVRRGAAVARVDIRELAEDECHGIWQSPGSSPE